MGGHRHRSTWAWRSRDFLCFLEFTLPGLPTPVSQRRLKPAVDKRWIRAYLATQLSGALRSPSAAGLKPCQAGPAPTRSCPFHLSRNEL